MKKIVLLLLLAFILAACGQQGNVMDNDSIIKEPPELVVSTNGNEVVAVLGEYSWSYENSDGTITNISVDSDIPPRIVKHQAIPINTELSSEISLKFAEQPQDIVVNIWNSSQVERQVDVEDAIFITDEKGYIIYEIIANWAQGSVHYAVKINVQ